MYYELGISVIILARPAVYSDISILTFISE